MSDLDRNALDRWITGGRYSKEFVVVTCPDCEETTSVVIETEYGASEWTPNECSRCGREFDGSEANEPDEPDPDRLYDEMRDREMDE